MEVENEKSKEIKWANANTLFTPSLSNDDIHTFEGYGEWINGDKQPILYNQNNQWTTAKTIDHK